MEFKKRLGVEMVSWFHSPGAAEQAKAEFERVVQQGELPTEIPDFPITPTTEGVTSVNGDTFAADVSRLLVAAGLVGSRGEARRLLQQNGVEIDGQRASDGTANVRFGAIVRAGRRRFVRVVKG